MKHALVAGLGLTEIIVLMFVTLIGPALLALFIFGIVRHFGKRRPSENPAWPLAGDPSPFQVQQAIAARLQSLGVTPWGIQVDRPARNVTVELMRPAAPRLDDEIRKTLAPLNVEVVWYEGSFEPVSRPPKAENPS